MFGIRKLGRRIQGYADACAYRLTAKRAFPEDSMLSVEATGAWIIDKENYIDALHRNSSAIELEADHILAHKYNVLGTGFRDWGEIVPWNFDIKSGRRWPVIYYKRLLNDRLTGIANSDVRVPWELSNFYHIAPLARAYLLFRDDRYAVEAVTQISSWIRENPFCYGVNWVCAMLVAIRACNMIFAWWAFRASAAWNEEFDVSFRRSLWEHATFIENNLEDKGDIRTNHYLADIVGILFVGIMFPAFDDSDRWRKFAVQELVRCMDEMVYEDGMSFENSLAYHRLVLEMFSYSAILCKKNGIDLHPRYFNKLEKMFEVFAFCMRSDGHIPIIGDSDDSRLFIFEDYFDWDRTDIRYLLHIGYSIFGRKDFRDSATVGMSKDGELYSGLFTF